MGWISHLSGGMGFMVMSISVMATAAELKQEPTGASLAWTSQDPAVVSARALLAEGKFTDAEKVLREAGDTDPARAEALDVIRRIRRDYSLSGDQLLKKLKGSIPGVTAADVERWRTAGELTYRMIDGVPAYFGREPSNLFRFCGEAKQMRGVQSDAKAAWTLEGHLKAVIAEAEKTGQTEVLPIRHTITYRLTLPPTATGIKPGALVRVWLPYPQEYRRQQYDVKLLSASGGDSQPFIAPVGEGEHTVTEGAPQRTMYFERRIGAEKPAKDLIFEAKFEYTCAAYYPKLKDDDAKALPEDWSGGNFNERPPHIVFTPALRAAVAEAVGSETNPLARARAIFHWINKHIAYHAEEEYCNIPSIATKALACRRGDCGVQATLFITMCRCAGIPARWQSGWETKPTDWNMHDWAEFYVAPWGWLPCDASYGVQKSDDPRVRDFYLGHQDSYRMIVNRDYGRQLTPEKKSLRSEPLDFQRGEVEVDGQNLYFDQWDYDFSFEQNKKY